jgi:hypothetical protein
MSFCCGASMIGTIGTLKYEQVFIHHVPILLCPVCLRVEAHHLIREEYEILAEFAVDDGAYELDFQEYVRLEKQTQLFVNCVNTDFDDPLQAVCNQIDMALDLISFANHLADEAWKEQLYKRLKVLSKRKEKLLAKRKSSR